VIGAVKGTVGHHVVESVHVLETIYVPINQFWEAPRIAYVAGKRLHQDWKPRFPLNDHVEDDLVQIRAMIPRIALLDADDTVFRRLVRILIRIVFPLERETGRVQMGKL